MASDRQLDTPVDAAVVVLVDEAKNGRLSICAGAGLSGTELRSIVLALKEWGNAYLNRGKEPVIFAHTCGAEFHTRTVCAACGEESEPGELRIIGGTDRVVGTPW